MNSLELKEKVKVALQFSCFHAINLSMKQDAEAMNFFLQYKGLNVSKLSPEMIEKIKQIGEEELDSYAKKNAFFAKVLKSQRDFRKLVEPYAALIRLPYPYAK